VLLIVVLGITERRVAHPLLRPALLRSRRRVGGLAVMALIFGGQLSMFFLAVQFIEHDLGFGPMASGLAFLPLTVGIFATSRVTPRIMAAVGPLPMIALGAVGLSASFAWLSTLDAGDSYVSGILGPMVLNGLSAGLAFMPITSIVLGGVEPEHAGAASGLLQTFQQLGGAVGLAVIVSVYAAGSVPGEFLPGAQAAFLTSATMAALAGVAGVAALYVRPRADAVAA
jgi:predicted MFS family arabinose efflux permease